MVTSVPQQVRRTARHLRQAGDELFLVSFQVAGIGEVRQAGRRAVLSAGDFAIYDATCPYELLFQEEFQQLVLTVPRDLLRKRAPSAERQTATVIRGDQGIGRLTGDMVTGLPAHVESMSGPTRSSVANSVLDLLATALAAQPVAEAGGTSNLKRFHLDRIKSYIREHLSDPELNVSSIGKALEMSVSSLYRAFEPERSSISQWIWDQRLQACHAALVDKNSFGLSIKQISTSWGFNDPAHFSRAFRRRFGKNPAAVRSRG
jgi:AraC-like DNA-binding protein